MARADEEPGGGAASRYEQALRQGRAALRTVVLDMAGEILAREGIAGLTMRRLAAALGCTTTVLYTMFASKQGLVDAMYREGFERLTARVRAIPSGAPPAERLRLSGVAYRENALASPELYQLTFGAAAPGHTPGPGAVAAAEEALGALIEIVEDCMDAGVLRRGDPRFTAEVLTAAAHGAVSLELSHYFWSTAGATKRYATLTRAASQAFAP
jgi:AcrR family transcriptional regulator